MLLCSPGHVRVHLKAWICWNFFGSFWPVLVSRIGHWPRCRLQFCHIRICSYIYICICVGLYFIHMPMTQSYHPFQTDLHKSRNWSWPKRRNDPRNVAKCFLFQKSSEKNQKKIFSIISILQVFLLLKMDLVYLVWKKRMIYWLLISIFKEKNNINFWFLFLVIWCPWYLSPTRSDPRQIKTPFKQRALHSLITCTGEERF